MFGLSCWTHPVNFLSVIVISVSVFDSSFHVTADSTAAEVESSTTIETTKVTTSSNEKSPSNPLSKYEFSYKITHDEGAEQGHQSSNEGVKSSGQYYVHLAGGEKQTVNYVADENGFHPHYSFKSSASESHFKSGAQVKPLNLSDSDRYEINIESQNGKIKSLDNRDSYATSPSLTILSSTESILSNEVNTALPSSVTGDILKLSKPEGTIYTPSIFSSASTESAPYEGSSLSPVTNASPSSSTRNIEEDENSVRHIIQDPNLPQSPLFVSSSERFLSTSSEKVPVKVYPSTPGSATTMSNVFYVNAQTNYNSTTAMLEGFESYLKDYLNANEVKSNDIDSNFKVISDKTELDRLIKQSGTEYEIIKLSDIMAEKKKKEKIALESTTPGYQQTQNIYTQIPSTHNTLSMTITTATDKISSETPGLMKYYEETSEDNGKNRKTSNLENEKLNSFVDQNTDPDSATSLKSSISQQFNVNYGEKTLSNKENTTPNRNTPSSYNTDSNEEKVSTTYNQPSSRYTIAPTYNTKLPYQNTAAAETFISSTENYLEEADNVEAYRGKGPNDNKNEEKEIMSGNQFTYYQNLNAPHNQGQEQIYFKELEVQNANINKNAQLVYSNLPLNYLGGVSPNAFYSQLQNNINEKQTNNNNNNNQYPSSPSESPYQNIPVSYTTSANVEQNGNEGQYRMLDTRYQPSTVSAVPNSPPPNTDKPTVLSEDNTANESPKIVFLSNGESGHIVKSINNLPEHNNVNTAVTISDIEAAKVDQLHVTTPKTVSKKDIDNNKLDESLVEKQNVHAMPTYTTTIEVFKSVPVEQYIIPDGAPILGAAHLQKTPPQDFQVGQNVYQGQTVAPNINIPYPIEQGAPLQKTILQPVYPSQGQRQQLFRPDPNYSREQKYYTDQIEETKTPYNIQPVPIPLNYGLKEYPTGQLAYRTPLSHQLQSIQQYGVPQYSVFTSPLSTDSMAVVHPSYSISVNPLPLHQIQQQMVSNSVPYASQFYPHYVPSDSNISQPNYINPAPPVKPPVKYYQPEKSIASEINVAEPYYYPKPLHNPFEYPAKPAYNQKTRLVPVAHHFNIPTTVLHLVRTPYKSTLSKLAKSTKYNPNESYYLKEMYNYAPQYPKENFHYDGHNPQFQETMHYDGRSKHAPFRPSFPMYDSVYPPMAYYETQYMAPNDQQYDQLNNNNNNNNNYRRPHIRSIRRPSTSGTMKKLTVEYGGFKPPMVPSTEIKEGAAQTSSPEK